MRVPLALVALCTAAASSVVAALDQSARKACVDLVGAAQDQPEKQAAYAIYTRCRLHGLKGGNLEPGCRELARLYSVARHYSDAAGGKLTSEDFCTTALTGSGLEKGPMHEVDACVAGAEEVLSSSEVSEAAEKACIRAHPKLAEAPAACRMYVASLSEALHHAPAGELVDAEAICGQLVDKQNAGRSAEPVAPAAPVAETETVDEKKFAEEQKFVSSCVQFAGGLMASPHISEDEVRKSCEVHLPSEEKIFCSGYAQLVYQKASAGDLSNFCVAEYRRMSLSLKPAAAPVAAVAAVAAVAVQPVQVVKPAPAAPVQQPKQVSHMAMSMPEMCARIFDQAISASLSGPALKSAASDLCTQEISHLEKPPPIARIRVGCKFFANRLSKMRDQQGSTPTSAANFCAQIATPQKKVVAAAVPVSQPVAQVAPEPVALVAPVPAVSRSVPIQPHAPVFVSAPPAAVPPLPVLSASAALPALNNAAAGPPPPSPEDAAKTKSDEDFLSKFLNKYEAQTEKPVLAAAPQKAAVKTDMKVLRDDEMAEVRRKAEQLFGSDVDPVGEAPAAQPAAVAPQPAAVPAAVVAAPVAAMQPPVVVAKAPVVAAAPSAVSKKQTSMISTDSGNEASSGAADFLSSFLNTYTGAEDAARPALPPLPLPVTPPQLATSGVAMIASAAVALPSPLALLAEAPPSAAAAAANSPMDVDSLVSAFLSRSGN